MRPLLIAAGLGLFANASASAQPNLVLTADGVETIQSVESAPPLFERALGKAKTRLETSFSEGIVIPVPRDPGGGYTHERHKENYKIIADAGMLFQITGDRRYADHAEAMLHAYADMYRGLPLHPEQKNQAPGRLFWQGLNESVWLVHVAQGYDATRDSLSAKSRIRIEEDLLRPVAEFLSTDSRRTFQRIHNHGTWAAAGVGMTGYAIGDDSLVERALLGLDGDGEAGFLKQLEELFSPDGYYTEGPYYQRYALMPFVVFAQAIDNNDPERAIFEYRDGVLKKAIFSTIQQSYGGKFFPINDAIKEKGLDTEELVHGVAAAYALTGETGLLSIAEAQGITVLTGDGMKVAQAVAAGMATDFPYQTQVLRDGPGGRQGGLAVLRMGEGPLAQTLVAKHTGQGMGHGHFDKLSLIFYDSGREILSDYGAARFLNVPSKDGGRYLPENTTWAKQSIAHNTIVLNGKSHFDGDWKRGQESWPTIDLFEESSGVNVISAIIDDAYPDTLLRRTTFQIEMEKSAPLILDVMDVVAPSNGTMDLPFYFAGQLTDTNLELNRNLGALEPLGDTNGYQHLWIEGQTAGAVANARFTWLAGGSFYTYHSLPSSPASFSVVRTGANDPNFNLRTEQGILLRVEGQASARLASVIEPHGIYDPAQEFTFQSDSQIASFETARWAAASVYILRFVDGSSLAVGVGADPGEKTRHRVRYGGKTYSWTGFQKVFR